jgi:uroporphyrinogen-III synthase
VIRPPVEGARGVVLITRPEPAAVETAKRVAVLGYVPMIESAMSVRLLPARLPQPEAVAAILVTSSNAIPAFPAEYHDVPLLAVGDATARRAKRAGFRHVLSAGGDSHALAGLVTGQIRLESGPLLLASGRGQGRDLAAMLRQRGFRVIRRAVYAAESRHGLSASAMAALRSGLVTHALFFSAETARIFSRQVRQAGLESCMTASEAVAISPQTSMALGSLPWRRITVAVTPDQDALLALLP